MASREAEPERLITLEEYEQLPDDESTWDEVVRGRLVREPVPLGNTPHGPVMARVAHLFLNFIEEHELELECGVHAGFVLEEVPLTLRGPDVWLKRPGHPVLERGSGWPLGAPALVVEVLSPSNRAGYMAQKVSNYLDGGAGLVWVLDPRKRRAVVHRPGLPARVLSAEDEIDGAEVLPGFRAQVAKLFFR